MTLERTLAEIEVLAQELVTRANSEMMPDSYYGTLRGVAKDAELIYSKYHGAKKAIKNKNRSDASVYIGELALDCKNLADNLNIFAQILYGSEPINLRSLARNTQNAPVTEEGKTLCEIFTATHDHSRAGLVKQCRDSKGHGKAHLILRDYLNPGRYTIQTDEIDNSHCMDAEAFVDEQAQAYLELARQVLRTIADKDESHFKKPANYRGVKTRLQLFRNFYQRHSRPLAIAAASVILTAGAIGGSLGTLAYQSHQREQKMKQAIEKRNFVADRNTGLVSDGDYWEAYAVESLEKEIATERKIELQRLLIAHPEFSPSYNLKKIFGIESNLFDRTLIELEAKSKDLGCWVDRYLARTPLDPKELANKNHTKRFLDNRQIYFSDLSKFSAENKGKIPTTDSLKTLEGLIKKAEQLEKSESEIVSFLPRLR